MNDELKPENNLPGKLLEIGIDMTIFPLLKFF